MTSIWLFHASSFFYSLPQLTHFPHPFCSNLIHPFPSLVSPSLLSYPVFYYLSTFTASPAILPPPLCLPLLAFCLPQTLFEMFNTLTENLLSTVSIYATSGNNELFGLRPSILSSVYSLCSSWNLKEKIPSV